VPDAGPSAESEILGRLDLDSFLAELRHEPHPILFIPNPGNAGDALIAHATRQLFDRLELDYEWVNDYRRLDPRGRVVIYGGGGNLVPLYAEASEALRWADGRARRLILLPHTVSGHEELLAGLGPATDLICREPVSHDHVRGAVRAASCHLADDLALSIDAGATLASPPAPLRVLPLYRRRLMYRMLLSPSRAGSVASPRKLRRSDQMFRARLVRLAQGEAPGVLHAFRTDAEQTGIPIPAENLDLSRLFFYGTRNANVCHTTALHLLRFLDTFDEVRTNRLHLAIGAAVLGKRVEFQSNSYFKNQAVYEFSMRDRFPEIEWIEAVQPTPGNRS
jgi:hypothetical protein